MDIASASVRVTDGRAAVPALSTSCDEWQT
jgi:hypothetical protein